MFSHYFDWAATAPADDTILQSALSKTQEAYANPSSVHAEGLKAKELLSIARTRCAASLGVKPETLIFTSGGTESDHLPILSLLQKPQVRGSTQSRGTIVISAIEHPAIREQTQMMKNCGFDVVQVPPEKNGIISVRRLMAAVDATTVLVCVMAVNNETGAVQPVYAIADALIAASAGKKKPKFHVDAVQTIGKIPFTLGYKGIDTAAISAHKLRGPRGIGLLYMANRQEPFIRGGAQEGGLRPGTENVFGALCLAECLERYALTPIIPSKEMPPVKSAFSATDASNAQTDFAYNNALFPLYESDFCKQSTDAPGSKTAVSCNESSKQDAHAQQKRIGESVAVSTIPTVPPLQNASAQERLATQYALCNEFIQNLRAVPSCSIIPECRTLDTKSTPSAYFSPWIVQASFKGIPGEVMVRSLSEKGFYISTGSACSARKMSRPVLEVMGITKEEATNAVRFSFGAETTKADIRDLAVAVTEVCAMFKR